MFSIYMNLSIIPDSAEEVCSPLEVHNRLDIQMIISSFWLLL